MMENNFNKKQLDHEQYEKMLQTGTTTVGIMIKDGVVVATDSQATAGTFVVSKQAQKLFEINKYTAATIAGGVADCSYVVNQLKALSRLKEVEEERVPEPKYVASICRNILFSGRSFFVSMILIGGFSRKEKSGKLYGIDLLGTLYEEDSFISFGSGSPFSLGVLEADWKPNLTKAKGIELIKTAISSSRERDAGSGYKIQLCTIDKNGFSQTE
ncbi:MAG: proteasome subunit beta [Promethearchaeota archaeon Loki_b32]|nr:MAG: proteasome subunit beta [Candidatus Lokiarchaeota archaeon Loki_b32]